MAFAKLFVCDACEGEALVTLAEVFVSGPGGAPLEYNGYSPIAGLMSRLWCRSCRASRPHILLRLDPPASHPVVAYAEAQRLGSTGAETGPCPVCGETLLIDAENSPCPDCETGILRFIGEWESAA